MMHHLKLQNHTQPLIDSSLQTRRQRAGMLGQEAAIEGQQLRDVHTVFATPE